MGIDSQALGNHCPAHRIEHDGSVYHFRLIDQSAKAEWERRLYQKTVAAIPSLAALKPKGWAESKLVDLDDEFLVGGFAFLGERSAKTLRTVEGMGLMLSILTGRELPELTPLLIARGTEVKALLHLILRESFPDIHVETGEDGSPNS